MATAFTRVADTVRDVRRTRQILAVLLRYGFGDRLARLPLEGPLALRARALRRSPLRTIASVSRAERVRRALEELGPTFVKFGQLLAGRPDIVPRDFGDELEKLHDEVAPMPFESARAVVESELGRPVGEVFREISPTPIAAGSIAQVHRATLPGGRAVALKIQRVDIQPVIEADLRILRHLATLSAGRLLSEELVDPVGLVEEFARMLERETDFRQERRAMARFRRNFASDATILIPEGFVELSTSRLLTMELMEGLRPAPPEELRAAGLDPERLARRGASAFVRMVLDHGHFHADPHGGNILFAPGDVVAFVDFGATGRLDAEMRDRILDLVVALAGRDLPRIATLFLEIGEPSGEVDRAKLEDDVSDFVDDWQGLPLGAIPISGLLFDFFGILRRNRIRFPADLVVLSRALISLEAEGKRLDPKFDLVAELGEPVRRLLARRASPVERVRRWVDSAERAGGLLSQIPGELRRVLAMIEEKKFEVRLAHQGLDGLVREIDRASNRIAFALIVAALVVGSAIVSTLGRPPYVWGYPAVGVFGFSLAGLLGLWLVVAILRSGKL